MGTVADSLFNVLMSWVRALVSAFWALFSSDQTTVLEFLGKNWLMIAVVIIAAGLVIDWIIWLMRWQPYHLWARRARRLLRIDRMEDEEDEETETPRAHAAVTRSHRALDEYRADHGIDDGLNDDLNDEPQRRRADMMFPPMPYMDEADEEAAMAQAESVPDEDLGAYPGMRYDSAAEGGEMSGTRRYPVMHEPGPGAAEVERRRAEIDAWQMQMQEEARAEAERAQREAQAVYEAEQARLAQEAQAAYEAEQARLAQEAQAAYEAEQARLAQEKYQRQLAEYERQRAQYERDLAEYERQKAAYEAELARQEAAAQTPAAQPRRRRAVKSTYSDYVEGEAVSELPDAPDWPKMETAHAAAKAPRKSRTQEEPHAAGSGLLGRMARMIEPEEEELISRTTLPPRVDPNEAFHTAKMPPIGKKSRR